MNMSELHKMAFQNYLLPISHRVSNLNLPKKLKLAKQKSPSTRQLFSFGGLILYF
jgi:hypothetical protein